RRGQEESASCHWRLKRDGQEGQARRATQRLYVAYSRAFDSAKVEERRDSAMAMRSSASLRLRGGLLLHLRRQFRQSLALGGDAKERCLRALRLGPRRLLAGALRTLAVLMRSFQRHVPPLVRDQCPAARLWQRRAPAQLAVSFLTPPL